MDYINENIQNRYPMEWRTAEELTECYVDGDDKLMKRAISNLIQNSIHHNENGCSIFVSVSESADRCLITVDDDGIGADDEQLEKLNHMPHYMVCDSSVSVQRHGLGLLLGKANRLGAPGTDDDRAQQLWRVFRYSVPADESMKAFLSFIPAFCPAKCAYRPGAESKMGKKIPGFASTPELSLLRHYLLLT